MKKYENFCNAYRNLKDIYSYEEPYNNVELTGLVGLYEICFEQAWKMMKEKLTESGFAESATSSPRTILKTAYKAGMIVDEQSWLTLCRHEIMLHMHIMKRLLWILFTRRRSRFMTCLVN